MEKISGSCLCNDITFELDNTFSQFHLCHCQQCQKVSGSAHVANLFTMPNSLQWLSGKDKVRRYDVPGRSITSAFCEKCGSPVPYASSNGEILIVPAGSLNGNPDIGPDDHIFWSERASWYEQVSTLPRCEGFPK